MADLDTPTLTEQQVAEAVNASYYAFMAGWSYSSSMANVKDYWEDDPAIQATISDRNLFLAVCARAIRAFYNRYDYDLNDIIRHVHRAYGG